MSESKESKDESIKLSQPWDQFKVLTRVSGIVIVTELQLIFLTTYDRLLYL
jgi:hypothetical protein